MQVLDNVDVQWLAGPGLYLICDLIGALQGLCSPGKRILVCQLCQSQGNYLTVISATLFPCRLANWASMACCLGSSSI